ncbi:MAG: hypothetical protein IJH94_00855 [Clostridia bacterium]|nr:hypothetical protein [Clostridia bacterium]
MAKCKRCGLKTVLSDEDIEKMKSEVRTMRGLRLIPDDEYERRLAVCYGCEKLEYGSTCTLCGCVVQVRAMLADGRCPYPGGSRWDLKFIRRKDDEDRKRDA